MSDPICTICIPTWNSQDFIERTLDNALSQTRTDIAVHVSIDASDDATAELCRQRAARDPRLRVWCQESRLGWAENCNFLIDQVDSPNYFFFFHDDLIEPVYVERLVALLEGTRDAASAHGDMVHFGATSHRTPGLALHGTATERLFGFLETPSQPVFLRSMTRTEAARGAGLRFEHICGAGIGAHHVYDLKLLAAGPALHSPEVLYHRWNNRPGGLTDGWKALELETLVQALGETARAIMRLTDHFASLEQAVLHTLAYLYTITRLRRAELERAVLTPLDAAVIVPEFSAGFTMASLTGQSVAVQQSALAAFAGLLALEADQAERRRDFDAAAAAFAAATIADPATPRYPARMQNISLKARFDFETFAGRSLDEARSLNLEDRIALVNRLSELRRPNPAAVS